MQSEEQAEILQRLRTTRGHLEAVIRMLERGESCERVFQQLGAVQAALRAVSSRLLLCQVNQSREVILYSDCPEDQIAELNRLSNLYALLCQYHKFVGILNGERKSE